MAVKVSRPVITAGVIFFALVAYFGLRSATRSDGGDAAQAVVETEAPAEKPSAAVTRLTAETHPVYVSLKGRTEPDRVVTVRSETAGTVVNARIAEGSVVKQGQTLCGLGIESRQARVDEAKAAVEANRVDYEAARDLAEKGWTSPNRAAAAKAALDSAQAALNAAEVEIRRTSLRAPFSGVFETRLAEAGDFLAPGGACGVVVDLDPVVVAVDVSEEVARSLQTGLTAAIILPGDQTLDGTVRYVSRTADNVTRTFRVEVETPNPDYAVTAGVSAGVRVLVGEAPAILLSPALMVLNDDGRVGVRHVDANGVVQFSAVKVVDDAEDGVWVTGLPENASVLTAGQDYLRDGLEVTVASAEDF